MPTILGMETLPDLGRFNIAEKDDLIRALFTHVAALMGVPPDGSCGILEYVVYGFPVRCKQGQYRIVQDLTIQTH